MWFFETDVTYY